MHVTSELVVQNISYHIKKQHILDQVSIDIKRGEIVGLLGPNGAGKTSLFRIISGLIMQHQGHIKLNDLNITHNPIHHRAQQGIAYLPQDISIFRGLSVEKNIWAALECLKHCSHQTKREKLDTLLKQFNLLNLRNRQASVLSGGECRRVEIARCLALNPNFILLDEPFTGLDPMAIQSTKHQIRLLANDNIGVLITDHNVSDTLNICDKIYILHQGRILTQGNPDQIIQHPLVRKIYLGIT
jgi:lipopolysaccharide export system ATP-binding protein